MLNKYTICAVSNICLIIPQHLCLCIKFNRVTNTNILVCNSHGYIKKMRVKMRASTAAAASYRYAQATEAFPAACCGHDV
ncbi:unnamed protein product [Trichogramma brassicae]|uniref:Uncharacterized protein n=1 Tax=Trichogramma brassicae TaxID=86971 RepID=A0A6H5IWI4_9HYME|nr:unnamed protein product [Trichogramma brassicae]